MRVFRRSLMEHCFAQERNSQKIFFVCNLLCEIAMQKNTEILLIGRWSPEICVVFQQIFLFLFVYKLQQISIKNIQIKEVPLFHEVSNEKYTLKNRNF